MLINLSLYCISNYVTVCRRPPILQTMRHYAFQVVQSIWVNGMFCYRYGFDTGQLVLSMSGTYRTCEGSSNHVFWVNGLNDSTSPITI